MFGSLGILAIIALIAVVARLHKRLGLMEREIGALRSFLLARPSTAVASVAAEPEEMPVEEAAQEIEPTTLLDRQDTVSQSPGELTTPAAESADQTADEPQPGPWTPQSEPAAASEPAHRPRNTDIETALGTRWAVWIGGLALALGGLFLVRYSIEAGIFGPGVRLTFAALLGLALVAAGEFVRRTGFKVPIEGAAAAYVPGVLTAAGAFTLFGAVYAAHGVYGFIGPASAFVLLGVIGVGTIAAALVHGQALAGIGLLGSLATPMLVSSQSPSAWALFVYLAIVLAANTVIARLRDWVLIAAAGFAGTGLWCLLYIMDSGTVDFSAVIFINAVMLSVLAFPWLGWREDRRSDAQEVDWPSVATGLLVSLAALALLTDSLFIAAGGNVHGTVLIAALVAVALHRPAGLPLLHAAGAASVLAYARLAFSGSFGVDIMGENLTVDGFEMLLPSSSTVPIGFVLAAIFLGAGYYRARSLVALHGREAAAWAGWGTLVPLAALASFWIAFGNIDRDFGYAAAALVLAAILAAGGEAVARKEQPPLTGGLAVTFALAGAGVASALMLHMAFGGLWTTMLLGLAAIVPALATRYRTYPVLGWLCVGAAIVVTGRVVVDPTIVGAMLLGRTPVFNALLPGYGFPALGFAFAAWQLARTTNGRPRLAMEAAAAMFSLLAVAMLVRHAMNGGVIDAGAPTLAEQAIYSLIAIGAGAILVALDRRSPSSVFRVGSMAAGIVSVACIVAQHFVILNPLFTDEGTGRIPVFNLLFLAYLLPAIAAGALALYARGKRPPWYSAMLGLMAAVLAFTYATLSVRRLFQGEHIAVWAGMGQVETYAYSALWLAMGVGLLVLGVRLASHVLRVASAVLIAVAVAKVFIFDMSELEGVLRALSFIGLGAVLIGIGLFYQKLLRGAGKTEAGI